MPKFLKENAIFFVNSILLIGLFASVSMLRKNQEKANMVPLDNTTVGTQDITQNTTGNTAEPPVVSNTVSLPTDAKITTKKVIAPTPSKVTPPSIRQRFRNGDED